MLNKDILQVHLRVLLFLACDDIALTVCFVRAFFAVFNFESLVFSYISANDFHECCLYS
jgi:hypothetical protein